MQHQAQPIVARLSIAGTLVFHKNGEVVKTIDMSGSVPLTPQQLKEVSDAIRN